MCAWVDYMTNVEEKGGGWGRRFHYGDWLALDNHGANDQVMGATDEDYIAYVYYMRSAELTANAADVLEKQEYAVKYRELEKQLREKIRKIYFSEDGRCCINTQTALILALKYNLTDNKVWTVHKLRSLFAKNHDKLQTGFVGTPLLG